MSRRKKKRERHQEAAVQLLMLGIFVLLLGWFFGESRFGAAFPSLSTVGWFMAVAGGVLLWLTRQRQPKVEPTTVRQASTRRVVMDLPPDQVANEIDELLRDQAPRDAYYRAKDRPAPRPNAWSRTVFDVIEWRRFEAVVEALFKQAGFATKTQSHGADQGVDVWLYVPEQSDRPIGLVQCKHWQKNFGVDKVRELRGVMAAQGIKRGHFATTSAFTADAKAFALANGINLLDIASLLALIAKRPAEQQAALLEVAFEGEYWRPTCASCGIKLVERERKTDGQPFWGCVNYPRCTTTIGMRSNAP